MVQRRRAAGTLLPGFCRAVELQWERLTSVHVQSTGSEALLAPLIGYKAFLEAAIIAVDVVALASIGQLMPQEQLRLCVVLLADAVELIIQPRICEHIALGTEGELVERMQALITRP